MASLKNTQLIILKNSKNNIQGWKEPQKTWVSDPTQRAYCQSMRPSELAILPKNSQPMPAVLYVFPLVLHLRAQSLTQNSLKRAHLWLRPPANSHLMFLISATLRSYPVPLLPRAFPTATVPPMG